MHVWWNAHHTDGTWWYLLFAVTQPYVFPLSKLTLSAHQECSTRCSQRMVAATWGDGGEVGEGGEGGQSGERDFIIRGWI